MNDCTRSSNEKVSRDQLRVLSLVDNNISVYHGVLGGRPLASRERTLRSLRKRGLLDGCDLTDKGRETLYWYRERSIAE